MSPIQLRPLDVIVLFNHVEGVWEGLDQTTRERHEATLGKLMANFATEKDAKMVFFTPVVRRIVSNPASRTSGEGFCLEVRSGGQNGGQACGGCPTPPVVGVKSPRRQPSPLPCRSFQGDDREPCASAQLGRVGRNEDHNRRSRFDSGADLDSTDL